MSFTLEQIQSLTHLYTHANCADGLASAMIIKDAIPTIEVTFLQYGTEEHLKLEPAPGMLFCDFAPEPTRVEEFIKAGTLVLDHHKTMRELVESFGANGIYADEVKDLGVSGALLAYREVWLPLYEAKGTKKTEAEAKLIENFARLAGIRDTWQKDDPAWNQANAQAAALMFYPKETWLDTARIFNQGDETRWGQRLHAGSILLSTRDFKAKHVVSSAYRFFSNGTEVTVFQGSSMTSDASEIALKNCDLVIGFSYIVENPSDVEGWTEKESKAKGPKLILSCRSGEKFEASEFAKSLGGGGHTRAAGCSVRVQLGDPNPYALIQDLVDNYTKTLVK